VRVGLCHIFARVRFMMAHSILLPMQQTPVHPDTVPRTPGPRHPHTRSQTPAYPTPDSHTPGPRHPHTRPQTLAHLAPDTRTPSPRHPYTQPQTPAHPAPDTHTPGPRHLRTSSSMICCMVSAGGSRYREPWPGYSNSHTSTSAGRCFTQWRRLEKLPHAYGNVNRRSRAPGSCRCARRQGVE
jgi:hypothetical protein